jgi:long-chain acyl-CoA synthetase
MTSGLVDWSCPDRPALYTEDGSVVSYGQLQAQVSLMARRFTERTLVFLLCTNDMPSLVAYLACLEAGAVPLLLDAEISSDSLKRLCSVYQPQFVYCSQLKTARLNQLAAIKATDDPALASYEAPAHPTLHASLALLLATSGSTGSPKLVRLSMRNLVSNAQSIVKYLHIDARDRAVTSLPFHYSYGLSVVHSHLQAGASLVLTQRGFFDPVFWRLMKNCQVSSLAGVPYNYEMLMKLRFERMDLPELRTLTQAGGKMPVELTRRVAEICQARGIRFYAMYGQTEASPRMAYLPPEHLPRKAGSIGRAIPGGHLWLQDEHAAVITQPGQTGELVYSGPNVALGYAQQLKDLALGDEWHGVLRTGDLARQDEDGFFYIEGRESRFIKLYGVRLSLDAVEAWFADRGYSAVALGRDDALCVTLEGADTHSTAAIGADLCAAMKIHPSALSLTMRPQLPRLGSGKVDYRTMGAPC